MFEIMEFTKETKSQFIGMFGKHEIVTISRKYGNTPASFEHKFIGMHNGLKWDFTPLVVNLTGCKATAGDLAARGFSKEILASALQHLKNDGFYVPDHLILYTSDYCQQFFF